MDQKEIKLEAYQRLFESSVLKIYEELPHIAKTLEEHGIHFVIIGGIAARSLNLRRETEDIDILISVEDKEKFKDLIDRGYHSFKPKTENSSIYFTWIGDKKVDVDILYSQTPYNNGTITYDDPGRLLAYVGDLPFLKLESFIKYKLMTGVEANRLKDKADVQSLIDIWDLPRNFTDNLKMDDKYREVYKDLWDNKPKSL